jgi:hypothetical protein
MAADLFVVPTVTWRLGFALVILGHDRRRMVHVAVTAHPTAAWMAQQLRNAFPENEAPRYLLHDRDAVFAHVATTLKGMNIQEVRTAPRSPCQNAYVERVIGSIRRECLDHVIVVNASGLCRVLTEYVAYDMRSRTHLGLAKDTPSPRPVTPPSAGRIVAFRTSAACNSWFISPSRRDTCTRLRVPLSEFVGTSSLQVFSPVEHHVQSTRTRLVLDHHESLAVGADVIVGERDVLKDIPVFEQLPRLRAEAPHESAARTSVKSPSRSHESTRGHRRARPGVRCGVGFSRSRTAGSHGDAMRAPLLAERCGPPSASRAIGATAIPTAHDQ